MALGETAKLLASLELDNRKFNAGVDASMGKLGSLGVKGVAVGTALGRGIERLAERGIGMLFGAFQAGEDGLHRLMDIEAQTGAVIQSTGGKAKVTAQQVRDLAEAQEALTTVDDKVVQAGENMLLTFTNIGSDVFPRATKAMVDMAVAMNGGNATGIDLKNTAIQIGKALNDPIKGVTALRKVGVALTEQQEEQIKNFIKNGEVGKAQAVILKELETEFGKAGEAAGKSGAAGVRRLADAVEDAQIALAEGLSPALDDIRGEIAAGLSDPSTKADLKNLGRWLGDAAKSGMAFAKSIPWGQVADGLKTAAGFAGGLVKAFTNMPPEVQATLLALVGLNKLSGGAVASVVGELGKGLIKGVLGINAGVVNVRAGVVSGGGGAGAVGAAGAAKTGISALGKVFLIGEAIGLVMAVRDVADAIGRGSLEQAQSIHETLTESLASPQTVDDLRTKLAAIDTGIDRLPKDPIGAWIFGETNAELERMRTDVVAALGELGTKNLQPLPDNISKKQESKFNALRDTVEDNRIATVQRLTEAKAAVDRVRTNAETNRIAIVTGGHSDADRIIAALHAMKLALSLNIRTGNTSVAYQSALFLNRASRLEARGIY